MSEDTYNARLDDAFHNGAAGADGKRPKQRDEDSEYILMKYELAGNALGIALWDMEVNSADPLNPENVFIWSDEFRQKLGFRDEQDFPNILQSWSNRLHPDDKERTLKAFAAHIGDYSGKTPYNLDYRLALKNGEYRYFHAFGNTLRGESGIPLRVAGALRDITERKQMELALEAALHESKNSLDDIKKGQAEIENREMLLQAVNRTVSYLLMSDIDSFEDALMMSMKVMAEAVKADRMNIWKNHTEDGRLYCSKIYEWTEGLCLLSKKEYTSGIAYGEAIPAWVEKLSKGISINDIVHNFAPKEREFLTGQSIVSILMVPVFIQHEFWGFVSLEDCNNERTFTENEQSIMHSAVFLFANAIIKNENAQKLTKMMESVKHRETLLSEEREFNRVIFEAAPVGLAVFDESLNIINCNDHILNMLKTDKDEFLSSFKKFLPEYQPDGSPSFETSRDIRKSTLSGELPVLEWVYKASDGENIPVEVTMARIKNKDKHYGLSFVYDLREMKSKEQELKEMAEREREASLQREAAQASNEAKSRFLANMSHEIRTPMNAIIGMSDLLLSEELNSRQHRFAEDIRISAQALLAIINDILDLSKIQAAKFVLAPVHSNIRTLIDNLNSMLSLLIKSKELNFYIYIQEELPAYLYGDDVRLRQVLLNLLSNAVKYTEEGGISLSFQVIGEDMLITVADTGVGIPESDIPTLFDAFERADILNTRDMQGTGLGLSITKALVELMGGSISVKSAYGIGTTFELALPMTPGDESLVKKELTRVETVCAPNARILAVDDRVTNLNVICGLLHQCQINADTAASGEQAIEMVLKKDYDLVFMDHMMPGMDGIEATAALRDRGFKIPVVALTANAGAGARELLIDAGMDDFLSKPIDRKELYRILERWLPPSMVSKKDSEQKCEEPQECDNDKIFWDRLERIDGLSTGIGLEASSNQRGSYKNTLEIFEREAEKSMKLLKEYLESKDARRFCIEVHGIKGSLSLVGAMGLSAKALKLENASRCEDLEFCAAHLPELLEDLTILHNGLREAFEQLRYSQVKIVIPQELPPILDKLNEAIDSGDFMTVYGEAALLEEMKFEGALAEEVEKLSAAALLMNYEHAKDIIDRLLQ